MLKNRSRIALVFDTHGAAFYRLVMPDKVRSTS